MFHLKCPLMFPSSSRPLVVYTFTRLCSATTSTNLLQIRFVFVLCFHQHGNRVPFISTITDHDCIHPRLASTLLLCIMTASYGSSWEIIFEYSHNASPLSCFCRWGRMASSAANVFFFSVRYYPHTASCDPIQQSTGRCVIVHILSSCLLRTVCVVSVYLSSFCSYTWHPIYRLCFTYSIFR